MDQSSPSWVQIAFGLLAAFLTGGAGHKLFNTLLNRKKLPAEIDETLARSVREKAEARKSNIEGDVQLNAIIERLHLRIDQMQIGIDGLRAERDECRTKVGMQEIELKLQGSQLKKMKGIMDSLGIKLSDFDRRDEC
jgi:hypothetical protein